MNFIVSEVVRLRKIWSAEQGAKGSAGSLCTVMLTVFAQMEVVTVLSVLYWVNLLNSLFHSALSYHIICPARRWGKRTVSGMLHMPLKIMLLHYSRNSRNYVFIILRQVFLLVFTLTDIFLQCPHDSFRAARWNR